MRWRAPAWQEDLSGSEARTAVDERVGDRGVQKSHPGAHVAEDLDDLRAAAPGEGALSVGSLPQPDQASSQARLGGAAWG